MRQNKMMAIMMMDRESVRKKVTELLTGSMGWDLRKYVDWLVTGTV